MNEFIEKPRNKQSLSRKGLLYGVGAKDVWYVTQYRDKDTGKMLRCPYYLKWIAMIARCYSANLSVNNPTYIGCTVSNEWLSLKNFKEWMEIQAWKGKDLDKDLINPGSKTYSQENCSFIPPALNRLLTDHRASRGGNLIGVYYRKSTNKYHSRCQIDGKPKFIGSYNSENEAYIMYLNAKIKEVKKWQDRISDARVIAGLSVICNEMSAKIREVAV